MSIQHDMSESIGVEQSSSSIVILINKETIFKVHALLRNENEMAYEPEIVGIGPYHRGKDRLRVIEGRKLRWFKSSLEQRGQGDETEYFEAMKRLEPKARQCYSESTENIKEDEFVEMLLLDAFFIIQFIQWFLDKNYISTDPFFRDWALNSFKRDMLLFENQIPLFVLQELFDKIKLPQDPPHFHDLAVKFLTSLLNDEFNLSITGSPLNSIHTNNSEHMLGLLHYILRSVAVNDFRADPNDSEHKLESESIPSAAKLQGAGSIPSAAKLQAAGVEFRSKNVDEGNPFQIKFENGVMEIPTFTIGDGTESLYRNLIAYEQYNQEASNRYVCRYVMLMDYLLDSAEDVALLRNSGIVVNALGDDKAVSSMFNKLVNHVSVTNAGSRQQAKLFVDVNDYYQKTGHKWMASLKSDYFNSPWSLISFLAAFFLLGLTVTQTVFSILGGV